MVFLKKIASAGTSIYGYLSFKSIIVKIGILESPWMMIKKKTGQSFKYIDNVLTIIKLCI